MRVPTLLVTIALLAAGPLAAAKRGNQGKGKAGGGTDLPVVVVDSGEFSGVTAAAEIVIRDPDSLNALWASHRPGTEPPAIDFGRDMVLAVFLGLRPTPNHSVEIESVRESDAAVEAQVIERRPRFNCVLPGQVTTPFQIVIVPARAKPVSFDIRVKNAPRCGG